MAQLQQAKQGEGGSLIALLPWCAHGLQDAFSGFHPALHHYWIILPAQGENLFSQQSVNFMLSRHCVLNVASQAIELPIIRDLQRSQILGIHLGVPTELPEVGIYSRAVQKNCDPLCQGLGQAHIATMQHV